jgi:ABC-type iron transport system FetAB permease component
MSRRPRVITLLIFSIGCSVVSLAAHWIVPLPRWVTPLEVVALLCVIVGATMLAREPGGGE